MAALTQQNPRRYDADVGPNYNHLPVKSGVQLYGGGAYAIELATGFVYVPVGNDAAEVFAGFADEDVLGDGSKTVRLRGRGVVVLDVTGVDGNNDYGKPVYAINDGTFSITDTGSDLLIGRVLRHITGTTAAVYFEAAPFRGADVPA